MSGRDLSLMGRLRQVLRLSSHGKGVAASVVETFRESVIEGEREMVRSILLGHPVRQSLRSLGSDKKGAEGYTRDLLL